MKSKRNLTALALGIMAMTVTAQEQSGQVGFKPHWYMQVQAGASYTLGEADFGKLISPAVALSGGYQFTSLWGLRAGISGWQAKGAWAVPENVYKFNYLQGNVDATLDLGNLFCGYNYKRAFNPYVFIGVGVNGAFNNDEAVFINDAGNKLEYLWRDSKVSIAGRAGIGAGIRLSNNLYINVEVNANMLTDKFNSKKGNSVDWHFNALAGLTFKFGKTYTHVEEPVPVAPVQPVRTETPKQEVKEEMFVVKQEVKDERINVNVFFLINSSDIRTSEAQKLNDIVKFLKENTEKKVSVCGYADKETGNSSFNRSLSQKRAQAVADLLEKNGIDKERIIVDFKGDTVQPFSKPEMNRVAICVSE